MSALDGRGLTSDSPPVRVADFFAGDPNSRDGVRVAVKSLDGQPDVLTAAGGKVQGYSGKTGRTAPAPDLPLGDLNGVFVG